MFICLVGILLWKISSENQADILNTTLQLIGYFQLIEFTSLYCMTSIGKRYTTCDRVPFYSVCVCVCVCVCLFPFTVEASPDWNKTINVMPEIKPAMLCWGNYCVKGLRRHVIDNHSRDLQASNCARVSIKPGGATRNKRQLLELSEN